ncbi:hypothetical protein BA011_04315 [Rhizobium leguminosarum]|uniref:Uncharacterized protein n=3 Tax=Rhizobium leguminosarum TaxID=384 RepID=A0A179BR58_RHILE|nr:hypothetical protein BA011_04315 [Rhizobium leguminosarum]OAP93783.1 hypothetical protein A4U53_23785 [Rhizobium leguminosarum]
MRRPSSESDMNAIPICFTTLPDYENSKVKNGGRKTISRGGSMPHVSTMKLPNTIIELNSLVAPRSVVVLMSD